MGTRGILPSSKLGGTPRAEKVGLCRAHTTPHTKQRFLVPGLSDCELQCSFAADSLRDLEQPSLPSQFRPQLIQL